jgi:hypothetical protein
VLVIRDRFDKVNCLPRSDRDCDKMSIILIVQCDLKLLVEFCCDDGSFTHKISDITISVDYYSFTESHASTLHINKPS